MGLKAHWTRRELLGSIAGIGSGSLLLPSRILEGQDKALRVPAIVRGTIRDAATGQKTAAKMSVTDGRDVFWPAGAIKTMPRRSDRRFFYVRGDYEIAIPGGFYQIEVVRGICHEAVNADIVVAPGATRVLDFTIPVLQDLHRTGWYSGNTHTHYNLDIEEDPDDRLRMVPPAEALDVSVISHAVRNDMPYVTNRYPVGRLADFSRGGTLIDVGQETRNDAGMRVPGYGHCLFLNIPRLVEPVSTGMLSRDGTMPDFPTISMLAGQARGLGGTTVWCHNGRGMEMPVAVALGQVDAFNLGDGDGPTYDLYYRLLGCGFHLPASTGTDWWIYDHNRVFVQLAGEFSYATWIEGLRAGRTFISNGPLVELEADGRGPGATVPVSGPLRVRARALSRVPFERLELVRDGEVIADRTALGMREARLEVEIPVERSGWLAARVAGNTRTHAGYAVFAHTSPVYLEVRGTVARRAAAAGAFVDDLEKAVGFIRAQCKFGSEADRAIALGRFEEGRKAYAALVR
jgi:hypothetical protein